MNYALMEESGEPGFYVENLQRAAGTERTNHWQHLSNRWFQSPQHNHFLKFTPLLLYIFISSLFDWHRFNKRDQ